MERTGTVWRRALLCGLNEPRFQDAGRGHAPVSYTHLDGRFRVQVGHLSGGGQQFQHIGAAAGHNSQLGQVGPGLLHGGHPADKFLFGRRLLKIVAGADDGYPGGVGLRLSLIHISDANGVGEVGNPKCGDIMRMYLKIENNVIVDVKFLTFGCGAAIATSSMATDLIKGKTVDEALKLTNKAVVEALEGLPPIKVHCSVLAEQAVKAALSDYYRRQGIDPEPIVGKIEEDCDHCESCGG